MISEEKLNKIDKLADDLALELINRTPYPIDGKFYQILVASLKLMAVTFSYEEDRNE